VQSSKLIKKFRFLPDIATADIAFEAYGKDYGELFESVGLALETTMVSLDSLKSLKTQSIKLSNKSLENLLLSFLEELVFLKDAEQMLFNQIKCEVKKSGKLYVVNCKLSGEKIDPKKHKLGVDVKAVTKHLFSLKKLSSASFVCRVVLDV